MTNTYFQYNCNISCKAVAYFRRIWIFKICYRKLRFPIWETRYWFYRLKLRHSVTPLTSYFADIFSSNANVRDRRKITAQNIVNWIFKLWPNPRWRVILQDRPTGRSDRVWLATLTNLTSPWLCSRDESGRWQWRGNIPRTWARVCESLPYDITLTTSYLHQKKIKSDLSHFLIGDIYYHKNFINIFSSFLIASQ